MNCPSKEDLRKQAVEIRDLIAKDRRTEAEMRAFQELQTCLPKEGYVLSYAPFRSELDIDPINTVLAEAHRLVLPKVTEIGLELYLVEDLKNCLELSAWGIFEPITQRCKKIQANEIALALIPGLAFDAQNYRLGFGKGFYDALQPKLTDAKTIGIGFLEQKIEHLPIDSWDLPLQKVLLF